MSCSTGPASLFLPVSLVPGAYSHVYLHVHKILLYSVLDYHTRVTKDYKKRTITKRAWKHERVFIMLLCCWFCIMLYSSYTSAATSTWNPQEELCSEDQLANPPSRFWMLTNTSNQCYFQRYVKHEFFTHIENIHETERQNIEESSSSNNTYTCYFYGEWSCIERLSAQYYQLFKRFGASQYKSVILIWEPYNHFLLSPQNCTHNLKTSTFFVSLFSGMVSSIGSLSQS